MKPSLFFVGITGFWLTMMSLLVHREFFQISAIQSQYQVLPLDLEVRAEYNSIRMGQERIGFNFIVLESKPDHPEAPFELRHQTLLSFRFLGHERQMLTRGMAKLDRNLNLKEFDVKISSADTWTTLKGQIAKDNLNLVIESNESDPVRRIVPMKGPVFYSESLRFLWTPENLKVGKQGTLQAWNPLLGGLQTSRFQVKEKTKMEHDGKMQDVFLVGVEFGGLETRTWVNQDGIVLKEEGMTGITLIKEEGWQIFDAMREKKPQLPDLPNLFSIPSNQDLKNPADLSSLEVKITTPQEEKQILLRKDDLQGIESIPLPVPGNPEELRPYLEATPWVETQDPEIQKQTRSIIGSSSSAFEASQKILGWVHENVAPIPSMSIPQSKQVLSLKKGDCNEYTVLFTTLARAAGIPTRMIAGLVYQNGRFYYHAWSEIYLGRWISVDPTFGQFPADAAHIPLIEGNLEEQVGLVSQIGNIKIEILEVNEE